MSYSSLLTSPATRRLCFTSAKLLLQLGSWLVIGFITLLGFVPVMMGAVMQTLSKRSLPAYVVWIVVVGVSVAARWAFDWMPVRWWVAGWTQLSLDALSAIVVGWFAAFGAGMVCAFREGRSP